MPTILTHPAIPLAMRIAQGKDRIPGRLLAAGVLAAVLPDADVIAFKLGIPYADAFGHRGFSHSFLFAALLALAGALFYRWFKARFHHCFLYIFVATVSHGLLDGITNGGLGIAYFWPWSTERFFFPVQVIEVAPLSLNRFLNGRGWEVLLSEGLWVWMPVLLVAFGCWEVRRLRLKHFG